jgi:glycosyltransferase involved in cell wall biosynthesis
MKALMLVSELEDYTISFANGVARSLPVTVAVPRRRYEGLADFFDPSVDLRLLDWPRHRSPSNPRFVAELVRLARRERPSVVHLLSNNTLWLNLALPLLGRAPIVTTVHDVDVHPGDSETAALPRWATDLVVRQSDDIVVHGAGLRRAAIARFRKSADRVHVLPHPSIGRYAQLARRQGLVRQSRGFTVLMFGRIYAYKGLLHLLEAEALLGGRIPDLRLVIAGRGDDPRSHGAAMGDPRRYDIRNRFIEDAEVAQLFIDADVVALPYVEASQSGVLNVAAAFGKPVVVTDVGELRATVEPNRLGLVVPPGNPSALAEALAQLAADPGLARDLGNRALAWAEGPNAPEAVGAEAASLYARILARGAVSPRVASEAATGGAAGHPR